MCSSDLNRAACWCWRLLGNFHHCRRRSLVWDEVRFLLVADPDRHEPVGVVITVKFDYMEKATAKVKIRWSCCFHRNAANPSIGDGVLFDS